MEAVKPRNGSGQSSYGPCLCGLSAPFSQETWGGALAAAPSCQLASWVLLFYLLLEENSLPLWVCCGSNKLPLFLPTLKRYKKQQSGQVTASWEESHKSGAQWWEEATVSVHQDLLLCVLPSRDTNTPRLQVYTQTHTITHTSKSNRSAELVKCTWLHTSVFKFLMKGIHRNYWWVGSCRMPWSLVTDSGWRWYTQLRQQSGSAWIYLVAGECEFGTLLHWEHPTLGVYMHNVYLFTDMLDSSCAMLGG